MRWPQQERLLARHRRLETCSIKVEYLKWRFYTHLPEDSMVDVSATVELDSIGELYALGDVTLG